jgi:hypothetical protein
MWLVGVGAAATMEVRNVFCVVTFEPHDLGVAFKGEDVGGDTVEEPAIV